MPDQEFGARLRELRKQASLSQRELANRVGVNFTYLSKIESGVMPPPSEKVILRLAEALNADKDELLTLAGKIPADVAQILKNREALQFLRSGRTQKKIRTADKKGGINIMKNLLNYKNLARVAIPIILVLAVAASLWFASPVPVKALNVTITNPPSGTLGSTYSFTVKIDITAIELVPIERVNLDIYNSANPTTYKATATGLPLANGDSRVYQSAETGGGTISVTATSPSNNWGYFSGTGYAIWKGTGYSFGTGYGYGYQAGAAAIIYSITWTSPAGWPSGSYNAAVNIIATSPTLSKTFIETSSAFTLYAGGGGGGGAAPAAPAPVVVAPGVVDVTKVVTTEGKFTQAVGVKSEDAKVELTIPKDTIGKTEEGAPISRISVTPVAAPPAPPAGASALGLTYELGPSGATFSPPITLTFAYDPTKIPEGGSEKDLVIYRWDEATSKWVELKDCVVDTVANTVSAPVASFGKYAIFARAVVAPPEVAPPAVTPPAVTPPEVTPPAVTPPVVAPPEEVVPEVPSAPLAWWVWLIVGLAAVVIIGVIIWIVIRRRTA